jgi:hypothetical protein
MARPEPMRNSAVHSANIVRLQEAIPSVSTVPIADTERVSTITDLSK